MPGAGITRYCVAGLCAFGLAACTQEKTTVDTTTDDPAMDPASIVNSVADQYFDFTLSRYPETAYFSGIELDRHDGITDNSPAARLADEAVFDLSLIHI